LDLIWVVLETSDHLPLHVIVRAPWHSSIQIHQFVLYLLEHVVAILAEVDELCLSLKVWPDKGQVLVYGAFVHNFDQLKASVRLAQALMPGHMVLQSRLDHVSIEKFFIIDMLAHRCVAHDENLVMKTVFVQMRGVIIAESPIVRVILLVISHFRFIIPWV
jgi:hypothetical protein